MANSYYELYLHMTWKTKHRDQMLITEIEPLIKKLVKDKSYDLGVHVMEVGNTEDHIHILVKFNPNIKIIDYIKQIKGYTSYYINNKTKESLYWQDGYGIVSVSKSGINVVSNYIKNQKQHHKLKKGIINILEEVM